MKGVIGPVIAAAVLASGGATLAAQGGAAAFDAHVAAARAAAGTDHLGRFDRICTPAAIRPAPDPARGGTTAASSTASAVQTYIDSAVRFRDIVARAGADGVIANHLNFDGSKTKLPLLAKRRPGDPHPYVIGNDAVQRYLTVAAECARAAQLALTEQR